MTKLRVRARAVDMLGRQQIAGIPTAIHELFKNAHDAYAECVEVDFFRRTRRLVIRDDGYGMTREDVENRWFALGTESRLNANRQSAEVWTGPKGLPRRTVMGEKGIGRLAIAVIAPITLLMTRAARPDGLHDLVVALVHWGLFEQPGLDISAIDVPIKDIPGGQLPTDQDIQSLVAAVRTNIQALEAELDGDAYRRLLKELDAISGVSPGRIDEELGRWAGAKPNLTLRGTGYGTHFILFPVAPELDDDIDGGSDKEASKLEKNLLGFSNTMTGELPVIQTEFRDHNISEFPQERIGPASFFTPEEIASTDHIFDGTFDEHGQFVGTLSVYGEPHRFVCNWLEGRGRRARCGSFSIRFGYVMGRKSESKLPSMEWDRLSDKVDRIGGLYIYRNGIRILPYGNSDVDFLDIEKRRTKSAQDWFFSFRRILGFTTITHEENSALSEKAGREGFRENQAYRDFRSILINFFQQLAMEFFRETAVQGDVYWKRKNEFKEQEELLRKQKRKANNRRSDLEKCLENFSKSYEDRSFERRAREIVENLESQILSIDHITELGDLAVHIRSLEKVTRANYQSLLSDAAISRPRGLSLTKGLQKEWAAYEKMAAGLRSSIFEPLLKRIDDLLSKAGSSRISAAQQREAALSALEDQRDAVIRELTTLRKESSGEAERTTAVLSQVLKDEFSLIRTRLEELIEEFARTSVEKPDEARALRYKVEEEFRALKEHEAGLFNAIRRQMAELADGLKARETIEDRFAALEQENQNLEEQLEFYADFAHLGMAVGTLQHEFEGAAKGLRGGVQELKAWAEKNTKLQDVYKRIRDHFDHLDGYLKALDPLGRRLHRETIQLSGEQILNNIWRIFGPKLDEERISLSATPMFREKSYACKSSTMTAAFVNVIDNAMYWISSRAEGERTIRLDADDNGFRIENTGPGVEERLCDRIFEFGETTKPGGRGMGLAVSRDALRKDGFDITLEQAGKNRNPIFRIGPLANEGENDR